MTIRRIKAFLVTAFMAMASSALNAQTLIPSLDSLLAYALPKSISLQTGDVRMAQAKKAKLAAILSIPDVSGSLTGSYTNNTLLPVSLFPGEFFGGAPGSYREVQTGVQYNTVFNENIDVKLLNPKGWESLRLARINIEATASDNRLTLKTLQENIVASYYNIINLQEQIINVKQNLEAADTLLSIVRNRQIEGLAKQQDVNDAMASRLNTKETLAQLYYLIRQQYLGLHVLTDIPASDSLKLTERVSEDWQPDRPLISTNTLAFNNSLLKEKLALSTYRQQKYALYPTLSFFQSYSSQRFSTDGKILGNDARWIPSSYIGLRLTVPIPSSSAISQTSKARYDYLAAQKTRQQESVQSALESLQLEAEFDKSLSQLSTNQEVYLLHKDSYEKNLLLYREGLISLDQTLTSFNNMVNGRYNLISAKVSLLAAKAKIQINNRIQ
ncbi:MAG TPA: TolC family protein [Flavisolibacter sp.]|nr:TolC family protein [Flavisolibacter sp.]